MPEINALKVAIELVHVPSRVRSLRAAPLPDGVGRLIAVAADDGAAMAESMALTGRTRDALRTAATFFIEQILLAPESDSYRVLGARADASIADLRRNMALLVRALHPDIDENKQRAIFAGRVTLAWEDLKTTERRQAYDARMVVAGRADLMGQKPAQAHVGRHTPATATRTAAAVAALARRQQDQRRRGSLMRRVLAYFSKAKP